MQGHVRKRHRPDCTQRINKQKRCNCDGKYQARYRDAEGKFVEKTFALKKEAESWLQLQQADRLRGDWIDPRKAERTFKEVSDAWRETWPNRLQNTTAAGYEDILSHHLIPTFGATQIGRIDHGLIQRYVNSMTAEGAAAGTVRNVFAVLRSVLNAAVRYGWLRANPCTGIDLPRARRSEMLFCTPAEIRTLAETIDPHYRTLIYTAAYTGLRAGELLALRWQDVDLLHDRLHVRRSLKEINGALEFGDVKTAGSRRSITLPAFLREMLKEHVKLSHDPSPDGLVFTSKTGRPIRHRAFRARHFKPAVATALLDKAALRPHDLRHSCASILIDAGAHPLLVSKQLGHSSVQITLDRYSHLFPDVAESLAAKLDELFTAATTQQPQAAPIPLRPAADEG